MSDEPDQLENIRAQHLAALSLHVLKYSPKYSAELLQVAENTAGGNINSSLPLICRACGYSIDLDDIEIVSPDPRITPKIVLRRKSIHKHPRPEHALLTCKNCNKKTKIVPEKENLVANATKGAVKGFQNQAPNMRSTNALSSILSKKPSRSMTTGTLFSNSNTNSYGLSISDFVH